MNIDPVSAVDALPHLTPLFPNSLFLLVTADGVIEKAWGRSDVIHAGRLPAPLRAFVDETAAEQLLTADPTVPFTGLKRHCVEFSALPGQTFDVWSRTLGNFYILLYIRPASDTDDLQRELYRWQSFVRAFSESVHDGILAVDAGGKILWWNRQFTSMWGISDDTLARRDQEPVAEHIRARTGTPGRFSAFSLDTAASPTSSPEEMHLLNGAIFERYCTPMDQNGERLGVLWTFRDISERRRSEIMLEQQHRFQKLTAEVSSLFVETNLEDSDLPIDTALELIRCHFRVDEVALYLVGRTELDMGRTYWRVRRKGLLSCSSEQKRIHHAWHSAQAQYPQWLVIEDRDHWDPPPHLDREYLIRSSVRSLLSIPIVDGEEIMAFFRLHCCENARSWTEAEMAQAGMIAEIIANALRRKQAEDTLAEHIIEAEMRGLEIERLYKRLDQELEKALGIYETVLQKELPAVDGLSMAAYHNPAWSIGGDFYQVLPTKNRLIVYLSDVTGHGLDGTVLSTFVKNTINAYVHVAPETMLRPWQITRCVKERMRQEDFPLDYSVSLFMGVLDLTTFEMTYTASGFQTPPLVLDAQKNLTKLVSPGLPLANSIPDDLINIEECSLYLEPGMRLFFSTDGLYDERINGQFYDSRVKQLLQDHAHLPPETFIDMITADFQAFLGDAEQKDDITCLTMDVGECPLLEKRYSGTFHSLLQIQADLDQRLPEHPKKDDFAGGIHELAANAIEHGCRQCPDSEVSIKITVNETAWTAVVTDPGDGFKWQKGREADACLYDESERGRGLYMTEILVGPLTFNAQGNRASVIMLVK